MELETLASNVAYAKVPAFSEDDIRVPIDIQNLPAGSEIPASISRAQLDKARVKPGELIFVKLSNTSNRRDDKTAILVSVSENGNPVTLTGEYNKRYGKPFFTANNKDIKVEFGIGEKPENLKEHGTHCWARVPLDFSPLSPRVNIPADQNKDSVTGQNILTTLFNKYDIRRGFSHRVMKEAMDISKQPLDFKGRDDLRDKNFFTIDPVQRKGILPDIDDSLCVEKLPNGGWRKYTAIADVANYVHFGTTLDKAAYQRANTIYLKDENLHMLPEPVVEKCSLFAGKDRPVIYLEEIYSPQMHCVQKKMGLGIISSKAELSYEEYALKCDRGDGLVADLSAFYKASRKQRHYRDIFEEIGRPYQGGGQHDASPVSDFMINMNNQMALFLYESGIPTLFRNNGPTLDRRTYANLYKKLKKIGLKIPKQPEKCDLVMLNEILKRIKNEDIGVQIRASDLVNRYLLDRAAYSRFNVGHYALKSSAYLHGTSPIRRYPDIIVHRGIRTMLGASFGLSAGEIKILDRRADYLNTKTQNTKDFHHDLGRYHAIRDLKRFEFQTLSASLLYVNKESVEIMLPEHGLRTKIKEAALKEMGCLIDKKNHELVFTGPDFEGSKRNFGRGETIRGTISGVEPEKALWGFDSLYAA